MTGMKRVLFFVSLAGIFVFTTGAGFPSLGKKNDGAPAAGAKSRDAIMGEQDGLIKQFKETQAKYMDAFELSAEALGLKIEAAALIAESRALIAGPVTADALDKGKKSQSGLLELTKNRMAKSEPLSAESKKIMGKSVVAFVEANLMEKKTVTVAVDLTKSAKDMVEKLPMLDKPKALDAIKPTLALGDYLPGDVITATATLKTYVDFCKSQNIQLDKDVKLALGD